MTGISVMSGTAYTPSGILYRTGLASTQSAEVPSGDRITSTQTFIHSRGGGPQELVNPVLQRAREAIGVANVGRNNADPLGLGNDRHALGNAQLHLGDGHACGHLELASCQRAARWTGHGLARGLSPATGGEGLTGRCRRRLQRRSLDVSAVLERDSVAASGGADVQQGQTRPSR